MEEYCLWLWEQPWEFIGCLKKEGQIMILLFEQEIPHYRVYVFEELAKKFNGNFKVYYGDAKKSSHHREEDLLRAKLELKPIKNHWVKGEALYFQNLIPIVKKEKPEAVIIRHAIGNVGMYLLLVYCRIKKIPVVLWGQGYSFKRKFSPESNWVDKVHLYLVKFCNSYVCYTEEISKNLSRYVSGAKLFIGRNTLNSRYLGEIHSELAGLNTATIKKELSLESVQYICYMGRYQKRKKIPELIIAVSKLQKKNSNVGLLLIGKGEKEDIEEIQNLAEKYKVKNFFQLGSLSDEEAGRYIYCADVIVIPGWLGLSVNHAFIFGKPVVSISEEYGHPPESDYLKGGYNGEWSENKSVLSDSIEKVLNNINFYSDNALKSGDELSIDSMVQGFKDAVDYAQKERG